MNHLFFSIETVADEPNAKKYIPEPSAPANYTDPVKIEAYIAKKKESLMDEAALNPDTGEITTITIRRSMLLDSQVILTTLIPTEEEADALSISCFQNEADMLNYFWQQYWLANGFVCGYNILDFGLPYLMRRSMHLSVALPEPLPRLHKFQIEPVLDLMAVLYNWQRDEYKSLSFTVTRMSETLPFDESHIPFFVKCADKMSDLVTIYSRMSGIYFPGERLM